MNDEPLSKSTLILYQTEDGRTRIQCRFEDETLWLTQVQIADLFQTSVPNINLHLKAIYGEGDLTTEATIKSHLIVRPEGARQVSRPVLHYSLPAILAVGFRVRSHRGTQFRQWATARLSEYLVKGFTMDDGKKRWAQAVTELSRAFALCAASDSATEIRDDVSFFQALQAALNKQSSNSRKTPEQMDAAIRQLVSKAITTDGQVIDVFTAAGLPKPDISILSDQFLAEVRGLKYKNVAAELLEKLLRDELRVRSRHNLVQAQVFSEKLRMALNGYHNRAISTMEVIEELIKLAKDLDAATKRGETLGLTNDEIAFYDALAANESAVQAMGDDKLKVIAAELITQVKKSVTIDWALRESARAKIKVMVKRILKKHGYPPDLQDEAVKTVLAQAELLCAEWV